MVANSLQIIPNTLLTSHLQQVPKSLQEAFDALHEAEISSPNFSFHTSVSSVYSSKIEGEDIELDSYIKHKKFGIAFLPDYTKKIDDLYFYSLIKIFLDLTFHRKKNTIKSRNHKYMIKFKVIL